jgi:hypothetical protein
MRQQYVRVRVYVNWQVWRCRVGKCQGIGAEADERPERFFVHKGGGGSKEQTKITALPNHAGRQLNYGDNACRQEGATNFARQTLKEAERPWPLYFKY